MFNAIRSWVPNWNSIAKIVDHKIWNLAFLFFVLMPIIALFMKDIPDQISISFNEELYTFNMALPFKWWVLYFSALAISIAKIIYSAFSPPFLKEYTDFEDFKKSGRNGGYLQKVAYELVPFWSKKGGISPYIKKFDNRIHTLNESGVEHALGANLWGSKTEPSFWLVYDVANYSRVIPRTLCVFCIAFSAIAFVYISIDKIRLVLSII
ncbi:hypothetical protein [Vibrio harveyi]|uniref:hypothetical protein n=1 Tax=Vibrio harveyi TaxID=669 RepID=UPI0005EEFE80|nr:hypothetical protein [Vibrio harveyi]